MAFGAGLGAFDNLSAFAADVLGLGNGTSAGPGGTSLVIQQLEGANPITIELRGRAMPYEGVEWEGELHTKKTVYPGNPVATIQVLGPEESETTIGGTWKDRFMPGSIVKNGNENDIDTAEKAVTLFHDLRRSGKQVRVQWLTEVRTGLITRFSPKWLRATDVEWEIEFEWASMNDEVPSRTAELFESNANDLLNLMNLIEDILTLAPDLAGAFVASLVDTINTVRDKVSKVVNLLRVVETIANLPGTLLGALEAAVGSLVRETQDLIRRIGGERLSNGILAPLVKGPWTPPEQPGSTSSGVTLSSSSATQEAKVEAWRRDMVRGLGGLSFGAQRAQQAVQGRLQPKTIQVITVTEGATLYGLAQKHYGSPDFANFLAVTNGLTSALVPAGFQLRIAPRPFGPQSGIELSGGRSDRCDPVTGEPCEFC